MKLGTAIEHLFDNYQKARFDETIRDKVAWALYQTWKEADEKRKQEDEGENSVRKKS